MNLLLLCEITAGLPLPAFGDALAEHINRKNHPNVRAAGLTAWNLLAYGLKQLGMEVLPTVEFEAGGKPYFIGCDLHFSLSHSEKLAAVLISPAPCAVDIERIRPEMRDRLYARCLSEAEQAAGCDFFVCWTKKECIGKLSGRGVPSHPGEIDTLESPYNDCFFTQAICDSAGQEYALTALCSDFIFPKIQKITPETLF